MRTILTEVRVSTPTQPEQHPEGCPLKKSLPSQ